MSHSALIPAHHRARDALLQAALDEPCDMIAMLDTQLRFVGANRACVDRIGTSPAELHGRGWQAVFPGASESDRANQQRCLAGETVRGESERVVRADGVEAYTAWTMQPWRNAEGEISGLILTTRDIADDAAARARAEQLRIAIENAHFGIAITQVGSNAALFANPAFLTLHGLPDNHPMGFDVLSLFPPERRDAVLAIYAAATQTAATQTAATQTAATQTAATQTAETVFEGRRVRRDGSSFEALTAFNVVRDGVGQPAYRIGTVLDITDLRSAQRAAAERDTKFRMYIEKSPLGVLTLDPAGRILDVNPMACTLLRDAPAAIADTPMVDWLVPADAPRFQECLASLAGQGSFYAEFALRRAQGGTFPALLSGVRLPDGTVLVKVQDIDELRRARDEIGLRDMRLRQYFDNAPIAIFVADGNRIIVEANAAAQRMWGYPAQEFLGQPTAVLYAPGGLATADSLRAVALTGQLAAGEVQMRRKDGSAFWARMSLSLQADGMMLGMMEDIDTLRRAEAAAQEQGSRLRHYLDNAPLGIMVGSREGVIIQANAAAEQLLRAPPGGLIGRPIPALHTPDETPAVLAALEEMQRNGRVTIDLRAAIDDGTQRWVNVTAFTLPDGKSMGLWLDIQARREAEEARREAEAEAGAIVHFMPGVVYRARVTGDAVRVIDVQGNMASLGIGDISIAALLDRPGTRDLLRRAVEGRLSETAEDSLVSRGNAPAVWLRHSVRIGNFVPGATTVIGHLQDVTAQREEANRLQRSATLLTLGEMMTGMAHELVQPLSGIGYAAHNIGMMLKAANAGLDWVVDKTERIERMAERAVRLVDHMRMFGHGDANAQAVAVAWRTALDGALEILGGQSRFMTLTIALPADLPHVLGNLLTMEQVLINLLRNAIDAYQGRYPNGERPGPWPVAIRAGQTGDQVHLRVADQAGGLPPEALARLFEPFFTTKPAGKGTGLGLSLCYAGLQALGGRIEAHNEDGGANFDIWLPVAPPLAA